MSIQKIKRKGILVPPFKCFLNLKRNIYNLIVVIFWQEKKRKNVIYKKKTLAFVFDQYFSTFLVVPKVRDELKYE